MMIRSIVCPIEFDEISGIALATAGALAQSTNAVLHVIHVIPQADDPQLEDDVRRLFQLQQTVQKHVTANVQTIELLLTGGAVDEIVRVTNNLDADLIVMATHARGNPKGVKFAPEKIAERVDCPVYALRVSTPPVGESIPFDFLTRKSICLN